MVTTITYGSEYLKNRGCYVMCKKGFAIKTQVVNLDGTYTIEWVKK